MNAIKKTEQKIQKFIASEKLIEPGDKLLIAFSGGPDSVFALHFFSKYRKKYKIQLMAVHFNHNLRAKESDQDELFCESFCEQLNIPVYTVQLDVKSFSKKNKFSIEEAARKLRYKNLEELASDFDCSKIITAHNQSDNTETILLNFFTGTGYSGFTGIPVKRENIIRPLLCISKQEILEYLNESKISSRVDSSNLKNDYKRNFLRNKIIPQLKEKLNPSLDDAIFRSSKNLEHFSVEVEKIFQRNIEKYIRKENECVRIKKEFFESNDREITGEILKRVLRDSFSHDFDFDDYEKIKSLSENQKGKSVQLASKLIAVREKDAIVLLNDKNSDSSVHMIKVGEIKNIGKNKFGIEHVEQKDVKIGSDKKLEFISADKLDDIFILRTWKSGDWFVPLGMKHKKKISDFLTDSGIETIKRKNCLVLENRNQIVWLVGLRIDDRVKINSKTKKVVKLWMK
jgi:tRNA(Ile)-lysidine synthase